MPIFLSPTTCPTVLEVDTQRRLTTEEEQAGVRLALASKRIEEAMPMTFGPSAKLSVWGVPREGSSMESTYDVVMPPGKLNLDHDVVLVFVPVPSEDPPLDIRAEDLQMPWLSRRVCPQGSGESGDILAGIVLCEIGGRAVVFVAALDYDQGRFGWIAASEPIALPFAGLEGWVEGMDAYVRDGVLTDKRFTFWPSAGEYPRHERDHGCQCGGCRRDAWSFTILNQDRRLYSGVQRLNALVQELISPEAQVEFDPRPTRDGEWHPEFRLKLADGSTLASSRAANLSGLRDALVALAYAARSLAPQPTTTTDAPC